MKKINFFIYVFYSIFIFKTLNANDNLGLKEYLEKKNIEDASTQIYLLNRCSAIYAYSSGIILKTDQVNSKKFIEIANNLLFKSVELKIIDNKEKLEDARKKAEEERKKLFDNYAAEGKRNWNKNKSYFKGSYISKDMTICAKLVDNK